MVVSAPGARWNALVAEIERHAERCPCEVCQCRRYLNYVPPERQSPATLKITAYGGEVGGSGEPDRHYDRVVREVDMQVALASVRDDFLRIVGGVNRNLKGMPDSRTGAMFRGAWPVMRWLERFRHAEWLEACLVDAPVGWWDEVGLFKLNGRYTLRRLLDECAVEMALNLGAKVEGKVRTWERPPELPAPPEGAKARRMR